MDQSFDVTSVEKEKPSDAEKRGTWSGRFDFVLSCIGIAVGLGNVWRFPSLCFRNGGGAFLVPYVIMLAVCGLPVFYLELAIGQFCSQGPITLYKKLNHYFVGIGWAMVVISILVSVYYNVVIMWSVFYLFASFAPEVPWKTCDPMWASSWCMVLHRIEDLDTDIERLNETARRYNVSCLAETSLNIENHTLGSYQSIADILKEYDYPSTFSHITFGDLELNNLPDVPQRITSLNDSKGLGLVLPSILLGAVNKVKKESFFKPCKKRIEIPSGDYFHRYMLGIQNSEGVGWLGIGKVKWQLFCVLTITWIIVYLCIVKGVASSGKVVYFTATFPYVVLIALLVRGVTLPGYMLGIEYYIIPDWERLRDPRVWADAATQIFYSLSVGFGSLLTFSSYNQFHNNCYRDAIVVSLINCCTSIFAGFAVFSIIGYIAYSTGLDVQDVPVSGEGLLFIAYPEAISRMPAPPLWAILFFFMVFTLGLDSQFGAIEMIVSSLVDQFSDQLRSKKEWVAFACCFFCLLTGIPCVTYGGIYIVTLMNWYCAGYSLMLVSFLNLIVISHLYGIENFYSDIEMMLGSRPSIYWRIMWSYISPLVILLIVIASAIQNKPASYRDYIFPEYVQGLGWATMAASAILIPIFFIVETCRYPDTREALKNEMRPSELWGPALEENRIGRYRVDIPFSDVADESGEEGHINSAFEEIDSKF